jgi:hypothetical protein
MEERDRPSLGVRLVTPGVLIILALGALGWFAVNLIGIVEQLISKSDSIMLNKGLFYMLGVGLGLATLAFVVVYEYWLDKTLNETMTNICTKFGIASVVVMLLLPQAAHFLTDEYLIKRNYSVCESASRQWLLSREIVYVVDPTLCKK